MLAQVVATSSTPAGILYTFWLLGSGTRISREILSSEQILDIGDIIQIGTNFFDGTFSYQKEEAPFKVVIPIDIINKLPIGPEYLYQPPSLNIPGTFKRGSI